MQRWPLLQHVLKAVATLAATMVINLKFCKQWHDNLRLMFLAAASVAVAMIVPVEVANLHTNLVPANLNMYTAPCQTLTGNPAMFP